MGSKKSRSKERLKGCFFNKDLPITRFWEVLDTQCVRFRHQESKLYPMMQQYGVGAKNNWCESLRVEWSPLKKDVPLESFWEVLDTQCVRFRHQESELYLMEQQYGGGAEID